MLPQLSKVIHLILLQRGIVVIAVVFHARKMSNRSNISPTPYKPTASNLYIGGNYQHPIIIRGIAGIANENVSDYASGITDGPQSRMEFVRESHKMSGVGSRRFCESLSPFTEIKWIVCEVVLVWAAI